MDGTTIAALHGRLIRDTFGQRLTDADAFLVFVLFHSHRIVLSGQILVGLPDARVVSADTQRGVSEALASAWAGTADERANPHYWYARWNGDWGAYGRAERLSSAEADRLGELRCELERHPFVDRLEPED